MTGITSLVLFTQEPSKAIRLDFFGRYYAGGNGLAAS